MSTYAWPFVFLCFVAVLWRGVEAVIATMALRTTLLVAHGLTLDEHAKQLAAITEHRAAVDETLRILNGKLVAITNRMGPAK